MNPLLKTTDLGVLFPYLTFDKKNSLFDSVSYIHRSIDGQYAPALYGTPSEELSRVLKEKMLDPLPIGVQVYFQLHTRSDGLISLHAAYDGIIGSRLIAHVDPKTVPQAQETRISAGPEELLASKRLFNPANA